MKLVQGWEEAESPSGLRREGQADWKRSPQPGAGRTQQPRGPSESSPSWRWPAALGCHSSGGSGGVCAMGDPERPEAARPEQEEVNMLPLSLRSHCHA